MSTKGLQNISAGDTELCLMGEGVNALYYVGYDATSLATNHSFELVCFLLTRRRFPTKSELSQYNTNLKSLCDLPKELRELLIKIPRSSDAMDVLRTAISYLGILEPEVNLENHFHIADKLMVLMPRIIACWRGIEINKTDSIAMATCKACCDGEFDDKAVHAMNASLILYAEHEFNASTFASRVTAATLSDIYSSVCSAIGTLRGPLHGGANREALKLIKEFKNAEEVEEKILAKLKQGQKLMGFGHRVYKTCDPRSKFLREMIRSDFDCLEFKIAEKIEQVILNEKNIISNVDFYTAVLYDKLNIPENLYVSIFVFGRIAGWVAHILEQRSNNRLIRPTANYIGCKPKQLDW